MARVSAAVVVLAGVLATAALAASTNFTELASSPEAVGDGPRSVAAADLDGDGDRDLAVANQDSDNVSILRNNGAGNFSQPATSPEPAGDFPVSIAAADFDGDGDQDLAAANLAADKVTILLKTGGGDFNQPATSPESVGDAPTSVAAADLDGDLDPDLAVVNSLSDSVIVLRNAGGGNFVISPTSPEPVGDAPSSVVTGDLDGDGDQDLAVANLGSDNVTILRNSGTGNFPDRRPEAAGDAPTSGAVADLDGDGDRDLAVANRDSDNVTILRNNVSGNFSQPASSPEPAGDGPASVAAANFDGDADQDLAVANLGADNLAVLRNAGTGNFTEVASSPEGTGFEPSAVAAADLDGDGDPDLAAANFASDNVTILRNR